MKTPKDLVKQSLKEVNPPFLLRFWVQVIRYGD